MKKILINTGLFILLLISITVLFFSCTKDKKTAPNSPASISASAKDYLSSTDYDKLVIQIQYVNGLQPTAGAVEDIKTFLSNRLNKPNGIEVVYSNINSPGRSVYTIEDIRNIEAINRTVKNEGKTITSYILFLDGEYSQNTSNSKTLGVAFGSSSMVIFEKTIRDFSGGLGQPSLGAAEVLVTEHELCHILGLVNNGSNMVAAHQDETHGKHCNNSNCLMYYEAETSNILNNLLGNNVPSLDQNCINDLKANGGK
ncbi:MAG: peptidase [Bacteroidetes bacterium]|nr:peptidase [Bacteroidota bacterium]